MITDTTELTMQFNYIYINISFYMYTHILYNYIMCVCVRACVRACVRVCVCACVYTHVFGHACVYVHIICACVYVWQFRHVTRTINYIRHIYKNNNGKCICMHACMHACKLVRSHIRMHACNTLTHVISLQKLSYQKALDNLFLT